MQFTEEMEKLNTVSNTKGGKYYLSTYSDNLDFFAHTMRFSPAEAKINLFKNAYSEDENLAIANLLYLLDIREGKGERSSFKSIFTYLCQNNTKEAVRVMNFIPLLGRYDYILCALHTPVEKEMLDMIKHQLELDVASEHPSLIAKWLPSLRCHGKTNPDAQYLAKYLGYSEHDYRKMLASLRERLNVTERNMSFSQYDKIVYSEVPSMALLKYRDAFQRNDKEAYQAYLDRVQSGLEKINANNLMGYEIIRRLHKGDESGTLDAMWNSQEDIFENDHKNILVVGDTSGSMCCNDYIPISTSIGLSLYCAERNNGIFKNRFITFSSHPYFQSVKGNTIAEKVHNIRAIIDSTDIDKVFRLILNALKSSKAPEDEVPSHILIISDMEFDEGVTSKDGTNFQGWKETFAEEGYTLPKVIFWNVGSTFGYPLCKYDQDCCMVSGFSPKVLSGILDMEEITPSMVMVHRLEKYLRLLAPQA